MRRLSSSPYSKALKRSKPRSRAVSVATCVLLSNTAISARERERAPELLHAAIFLDQLGLATNFCENDTARIERHSAFDDADFMRIIQQLPDCTICQAALAFDLLFSVFFTSVEFHPKRG